MGAKGHPGYCKICDSPYVAPINKLLEQDKNEAEVKRVIQLIDPKFTWSRQTLYSHKEHITHPLITHAKQAALEPAIVPKTNTGFLELIREIGAQRAVDHPDEVSIEHSIKAAGILEARREKKDELWIILAKAQTNQLPDELIGEYKMLPTTVVGEEVQPDGN